MCLSIRYIIIHVPKIVPIFSIVIEFIWAKETKSLVLTLFGTKILCLVCEWYLLLFHNNLFLLEFLFSLILIL